MYSFMLYSFKHRLKDGQEWERVNWVLSLPKVCLTLLITPVIFALNLKKPLVFHHTYQKQKQPKNEEGIKSVISFELPGITWQYLFRAKERLQTHHFY